MIKGGVPTGALSSRPHGMQISSSVYGKAVKLVYGVTQAAPDLVWYNDWKTLNHPSNSALASVTGSGGGKKKSSKKSNVKYYSAALDLLLGHAPIAGVLTIWFNNQKFAVVPCSASGFISGGQFSFTPTGGNSRATVTASVPGSGPYTITAADFVSDLNDVSVAGAPLQPAAYPPGAGQYSVDTGGVYTFNSAQAGLSATIGYRKSGSGSAATLAAIYACTVAENFSTTFDDYGAASGEVVYGTWERPLWNAAFAVPGRLDSGAFRARDPYTWWWDGNTAVANFPAALNGLPVTVYYGVPAIYKSDDTFYSDRLTPLALLNLEFEPSFASGAEYANHSDQQIVQNWCAGLGSVQFDLGMANAMPNLNLECLGAFAQWPNGDCDVADIVADIVSSGPIWGGT